METPNSHTKLLLAHVLSSSNPTFAEHIINISTPASPYSFARRSGSTCLSFGAFPWPLFLLLLAIPLGPITSLTLPHVGPPSPSLDTLPPPSNLFFALFQLFSSHLSSLNWVSIMDGRGGCCIARYATGAYDMSKVQRIMLRFRPIAPKPTTGSNNSGSSSSESSDAFPKGGRQKRKYVKDGGANNGKRCNRRRKLSPEQNGPVVTLPLLPETPDPKNTLAIDPTVVCAPKDILNNGSDVPMWLNFENENMAPGKVEPPAAPFWYSDQSPMKVAAEGSCVTVECVTETWVELEELGGTDEERAVRLSKDTCPAFISDGYGRVTWTNGAYRSMMGPGGGGREQGVRLVMKEKAGMAVKRAVVRFPSFTCQVRVEYTCGSKKSSLTVPCDVWRLDSGGFAWRLDVKAALSL